MGEVQVLEQAAPAKVNLGLRIVGRREDGYHLLESIFVPIDWADHVRIEIAPAERTSLSLDVQTASDAPVPQAAIPTDETNLAHRAARVAIDEVARADANAARVSLRVTLTKRVPSGAGLGGGSSDAGTVLSLLGAHFGPALPSSRLAELALSLGADVPFFLDPKPCLVSGIGERLAPIEGFPSWSLLLAGPGEPLGTPQVYAAAAALRGDGPFSPSGGLGSVWRAMAEAAARGEASPDDLAALLVNDLEPGAVRLCPPVARLEGAVARAGALAAGMSGSGATVYGVFRSPESAAAAAAELSNAESGWFKPVRTGASV